MLSKRYSLTWFQEKYIDLLEMSPREDSFQDLIVYPMIDAILSNRIINEYDIVDSKNFRQFNTKEHDRRKYSVLTKAVPDLLIAKDFIYKNRKIEVQEQLQVKVTIEIKEPNSNEMLNRDLYDLKGKCYKDSLYLEVVPSLFKNGKSILTNLRRWHFFDTNMIKDKKLLESIGEYVLIQELCGFDNIEECYNKRKGMKGMPAYIPTDEALKEHEEHLRNVEIKNTEMQKTINSSKSINFKYVQKRSDEIYFNDIRDYLYKSQKYESIELMNNESPMVVDRTAKQVGLNIISCVSDLKINTNKWYTLLKYIDEFIE